MNSFIRTDDHLTIMFEDGDVVTVYTTNPNYEDVVAAINAKEWDEVRRLAVPAHTMREQFENDERFGNRVTIEGGVVMLDGIGMDNSLTRRMLDMVDEGFDITPMSNFLINLMENPSYRAVNELYDFLEHSDLPITTDGHFVAYKRVRGNYTDCHTGKVDNSIGATPEMKRNLVDEDKNRTCSSGLHFCSREYLPHFGTSSGHRTVVVKINPRDVVSIPADYNNAKGRCCRYEVIGELDHNNEEEIEGSMYGVLDDVDLEELEITDDEWDAIYDEAAEFESLRPGTDRFVNALERETSDATVIEMVKDGRVVQTFTDARHAMRETGIDSSSITKVCKGKRNSAGGYQWRYKQVQAHNSIPSITVDATLRIRPKYDEDDPSWLDGEDEDDYY